MGGKRILSIREDLRRYVGKSGCMERIKYAMLLELSLSWAVDNCLNVTISPHSFQVNVKLLDPNS
jgi:hypothetical protein